MSEVQIYKRGISADELQYLNKVSEMREENATANRLRGGSDI